MGVRYVTRESVKEALDVAESARADAQVDTAAESASRLAEGFLRRRFYPQIDTRYFDWPNIFSRRSYLLWLDSNEMVSVASVVSGGTTISASNYFLRRSDDKSEPPYDRLELNIGSTQTFVQGSTHQKNIAVAGVYGYCNTTEPAGALAEALDTSETGVDVTDSAAVGVGDLILVDTEYMQVTDKTMLDTGVDIDATDSLTAQKSDVSITLSTTTGAPAVGETVLIDSERMLVVDKAGAVLTVKRATDGSVLATHATGASIYAPRTLTVSRAAVGSTAAVHSNTAAVSRHVPPAPVTELSLAYALNNLLQRRSGYARIAGEGDSAREFTGRGIRALEQSAWQSCGRLRTECL